MISDYISIWKKLWVNNMSSEIEPNEKVQKLYHKEKSIIQNKDYKEALTISKNSKFDKCWLKQSDEPNSEVLISNPADIAALNSCFSSENYRTLISESFTNRVDYNRVYKKKISSYSENTILEDNNSQPNKISLRSNTFYKPSILYNSNTTHRSLSYKGVAIHSGLCRAIARKRSNRTISLWINTIQSRIITSCKEVLSQNNSYKAALLCALIGESLAINAGLHKDFTAIVFNIPAATMGLHVSLSENVAMLPGLCNFLITCSAFNSLTLVHRFLALGLHGLVYTPVSCTLMPIIMGLAATAYYKNYLSVLRSVLRDPKMAFAHGNLKYEPIPGIPGFFVPRHIKTGEVMIVDKEDACYIFNSLTSKRQSTSHIVNGEYLELERSLKDILQLTRVGYFISSSGIAIDATILLKHLKKNVSVTPAVILN